MELNTQLSKDFFDYAGYVNYHRALPSLFDGLKPSQRRILYAMHKLNLVPEQGTVKCAKVVGDTIGSYHPHGK